MMKVELSKRGLVEIVGAAASNPGRCGSEMNNKFDYTVKLICDSKDLTEQDFVIDHNLIGEYFTNTYSKKKEQIILSCEMIAMRALNYFHTQFNENRVRIKSIEVNIIADSVSHRAFWEYSWGTTPVVPEPKTELCRIGERWQNQVA